MSMKKAVSMQEGVNQKQEESKAGLKNQSLLNQTDKHENRNTFRLVAHARKRLQAAFESSAHLLKVSEDVLEGFSKFETEAYVLSTQAAYLIEVKKFQEALDILMRAKLIYSKVATYKDSIEAVIYQEKIG